MPGDPNRLKQIRERFVAMKKKEMAALKLAKREAAAAIQKAMEQRQVPGRAVAESELAKLPEKEKIVEPGRQTTRSGKAERSMQRGKLKLVYAREQNPSAWLNMDIFSRTGSSLLNNQLQDKLGAGKIARLLYALNPNDKEEAARVLKEQAHIIGPMLWRMDSAEPADVLREIRLKRILARKFVRGEEDIDALCGMVSQSARFPGWTAISEKWKEISMLAPGRNAIITPEYVMRHMGGELVGSAMKIRNEVERRDAAHEEERAAAESERAQKRYVEELRRRAQQGENQVIENAHKTRAMPPAEKKLVNKREGPTTWTYKITGNTVKFTSGGSGHTEKIKSLGRGLEFVRGPSGETLIVHANGVRAPTAAELALIEKTEPTKRERRTA